MQHDSVHLRIVRTEGPTTHTIVVRHFAARAATANVSVSLGDIEVAAKIALLDPFGGDLQASAVTGGATVTIDPATLVQGTAFSEHRIGWGVSLSDLFAFSQGRTGFPLDVTYLHFQTIKGNDVPKTFSDQIQLRWYTPRLFGSGGWRD